MKKKYNKIKKKTHKIKQISFSSIPTSQNKNSKPYRITLLLHVTYIYNRTFCTYKYMYIPGTLQKIFFTVLTWACSKNIKVKLEKFPDHPTDVFTCYIIHSLGIPLTTCLWFVKDAQY